MKKLIISALALVLSAGAFNAQAQDDKAAQAQAKAELKALQSNLKQAKKLSEAVENPDFEGARAQIKEAFQNPQAKANLADINFAAAQVEFAQFNNERNKPANGGTMNEQVVLKCAYEGYNYYQTAYNEYKKPDAKGKINTKNNPVIQANAWECFRCSGGFRANAGQSYMAKDWQNAYNYFDLSLKATESEMIKTYVASNPLAQVDFGMYEADSTKNQTAFNRAVVAINMAEGGSREQHLRAIKELEYLKDKNYEPTLVYQSIVREYACIPDTGRMISVLEEGVRKFPRDDWYSKNLMNIYLERKDYDRAAKNIDAIVAQDPNNAQYVTLKGQLQEMQGNTEGALASYQKALQLDPSLGSAYSYIGRIYYNRATDRENELYEQRKYDLVDQETSPLYEQALPFYEKAFAFDSEHTDTTIPQALRTILYRKFQKKSCPNKQELINQYNTVSEAYNLPLFVK